MKNWKHSITSMVLVLVLLVSSFVPLYASESASSAYAAGYSTGYSTEYNSGKRTEVCTSLDGTSAASYYRDYSYDDLSTLSSDELFESLQTLMRETHDYVSSYDDCHYKASQTDCQNGDGSVSLIYTGYSATMSQWNGWNREHVWPQSLGGNSTVGGGADLHHIRPSDAGVNSSRGNKKYGDSGSNPSEKYGTDPAVGVLGGTYNSNYFEPLDSVKGDVARICLYVYVRWNSDWGASNITSVFQSIDVLLEWCELDPVDTWEMGRNEVVGAIQGNRNVFIDYPEYAWLIFGREVPNDMETPSNNASGGSTVCPHSNKTTTTVDATCTAAGSVTVKCDTCGTVLSTTEIAATGHNYVDGVCACGQTQAAGTEAGVNIADYADKNAWVNGQKYTSLNVDENITVTVSGGANSGKYYTSGENWRIYQTETPSITVNAANGYTISSVKITYETANSGILTLNGSSVATGASVPVNSDSITFGVGNSGSNTNGQVRITDIKVTYNKVNEEPPCEHASKTTTTVEATCTVAGLVTVECNDCGAVLSQTVLPATGHLNTTESTVDATCTENGAITVSCNDCGATVSSTVIVATGHSLVGIACAKCGYTEKTANEPQQLGWTQVTDASDLKAGDKIVITSGTFVAGNISNSVMASVSGVEASDDIIQTLPDGAVIFTLGGESGAWTLSNDSGKLLGATAVKKLAWGSGTTTWDITVSNDGAATIASTSSSYGRFLYNKNSPRFTTYTSSTNASMLLPTIYRYTEAAGTGAEIVDSSMTPGSTLTMHYYVAGYDKSTDYYMVFTINGDESERITGVEKNGYLVFSFTGIPPQYMADSISAYLYTGNDETPISTMENNSVKAYAERAIAAHGSDTKLMNLIADMLRYGAAAQLYTNHNTDALVTDGFDLGSKGSSALPTEDDNDRTLDPMTDTSVLVNTFASMGVRFDFDNKIYFRIRTEDISKIKITVNGVEADLTGEDAYLGNGTYIFYTGGICATDFDEIFTFRMYVDGVLCQTATYSVNSYAYAKCGDLTVADETSLSPIAQLVRALYRYGLSAEAYIG